MKKFEKFFLTEIEIQPAYFGPYGASDERILLTLQSLDETYKIARYVQDGGPAFRVLYKIGNSKHIKIPVEVAFGPEEYGSKVIAIKVK